MSETGSVLLYKTCRKLGLFFCTTACPILVQFCYTTTCQRLGLFCYTTTCRKVCVLFFFIKQRVGKWSLFYLLYNNVSENWVSFVIQQRIANWVCFVIYKRIVNGFLFMLRGREKKAFYRTFCVQRQRLAIYNGPNTSQSFPSFHLQTKEHSF